MILFLVAVVLFYAFVPEYITVDLLIGEFDNIDKEVVFYSALVIFLVMNVLLVGCSRYIIALRKNNITREFQLVRENLSRWLINFCAILNLNLFFLLLTFGLQNFDEEVPFYLYGWAIYLGIVLVATALFRLIQFTLTKAVGGLVD
jgi:hypothetical protein